MKNPKNPKLSMVNEIYLKLGFRSTTEYIITKIRSGLKNDTDFLLNFEKIRASKNKS